MSIWTFYALFKLFVDEMYFEAVSVRYQQFGLGGLLVKKKPSSSQYSTISQEVKYLCWKKFRRSGCELDYFFMNN